MVLKSIEKELLASNGETVMLGEEVNNGAAGRPKEQLLKVQAIVKAKMARGEPS